MIKGIGLDMVELHRIEKAAQRTERFAKRILSDREYTRYELLSHTRKTEFLAGRFAAKEAFSKARGTGIGQGCEFQDIEILNDEKGAPILYFKQNKVNGFVSITHTQTCAAAQVIILV